MLFRSNTNCQTAGHFGGYLYHNLGPKVLKCSRGAWVAQSVERPASARVTISRSVSLSPASGSVLTARSLEPASDSVSPSLSVPPPAHALSLSVSERHQQINKMFKIMCSPLFGSFLHPGDIQPTISLGFSLRFACISHFICVCFEFLFHMDCQRVVRC